MQILGGRYDVEWPVKVIWIRGHGFWRGFGVTRRGWPIRRARWFGYAPLSSKRDTEQEGDR